MLERRVHIQEDEVGKGNILVSLRGTKIKSYNERNFRGGKNTLNTAVLRTNVLINSHLKEDIVKLTATTKEMTRLSSRERSMRGQIRTISLSKD